VVLGVLGVSNVQADRLQERRAALGVAAPLGGHAAEGLEEALGLSWRAELSEQDRLVVS